MTNPETAAFPLSPIDLRHLEAATFGDTELRNEVLSLFLQQTDALLAQISTSGGSEIAAVAHKLKGSARGIGALGVAAAAESLERNWSDPDARSRGIAALRESVAAARIRIGELMG